LLDYTLYHALTYVSQTEPTYGGGWKKCKKVLEGVYQRQTAIFLKNLSYMLIFARKRLILFARLSWYSKGPKNL
jgi:hypothetical protein